MFGSERATGRVAGGELIVRFSAVRSDTLKRKGSNKLVPIVYDDPETVGRSPVDFDTDRAPEVVLVNLSRSPVCVVPQPPVYDGFIYHLLQQRDGHARSILPCPGSRAVRPMPFHDMADCPLIDYHRRSVAGVAGILCSRVPASGQDHKEDDPDRPGPGGRPSANVGFAHGENSRSSLIARAASEAPKTPVPATRTFAPDSRAIAAVFG